jgi:hypothetical protein
VPPQAHPKPSSAAVIAVLAFLILLISGIITTAFVLKPSPTYFDIEYNNALSAVRDPLNPYPTQVDCGGGVTWSVALSNSNLQLNWFSNSTSRTVWDTNDGICGTNSISYAILSATSWRTLSASNFPITSSYTRMAYTPTWADPQTGNVTRYNLNLYCGFLRIETDLSNSFGAWNNFQGILRPTPLTLWPHQENRNQIVWQLWNPNADRLAVQFRGNGELSVVAPSDPFNSRGIGNSNWYASEFVPTEC